MSVVSLFSGCGGMDLGFINAGFDIIYANDFDKYAVQSYRHNIGDHIVEADISEIREEEIPPHDVLIGGFPCQPFSMMGARQGLDDVRGTLFYDVARIVARHEPQVAVLENVRALTSHDGGRTIQVIQDTFRRIGYRTEIHHFNSVNFGVPQIRNRVFIICIREDLDMEFTPPEPVILNTEVTNLRSILEEDVDPKYYLSHRILPTILAHGSGNYYSRSEIDLDIARPLTATMAKMHRANQDNYVTDPSERALEAGKTQIRRLTPRECARLQGFPDGYDIIVSDTQAYKQFGNAVTVNVAHAIADKINEMLTVMTAR